jgi:CRISPR-associated protein Csx10
VRIDYTLTPEGRVSAGRTGQVQNVRRIHQVVPGSVVRGALGAAWWSPLGTGFTPASQPRFDELFARAMDVRAAIPRRTEAEKVREAAFHPFSWAACKYHNRQGCSRRWHDQAVALAQGSTQWLRDCPSCGQPLEHPKQGWGVPAEWSVATVRTALVNGVAQNDQLYTRRAMLRDVSYAGSLRLRASPDPAVVEWLLTPKVLRIGGQRSTMGACQWEAAVADDPLPLVGDTCVVHLLAPAILIDSFGGPSLDLAQAINDLLRPAAAGQVSRVWTRPEVVSGWNGVAGLPKASEWAIAAGSVALITASTSDTAALLGDGIGLRRAEGYGHLQIVPIDADTPIVVGPREAEAAHPPGEPTAPGLAEENLSLVEKLVRMLTSGLEEPTLRAVLAEAQRVKQLRDGGFPDHIVSQRVESLRNKPWMRDLSGGAQAAAADILLSPAVGEHRLELSVLIDTVGGSR